MKYLDKGFRKGFVRLCDDESLHIIEKWDVEDDDYYRKRKIWVHYDDIDDLVRALIKSKHKMEAINEEKGYML